MIKKLSLTIYLLAIALCGANAQSWQWGVRGGSADAGCCGGPDETVVDMATDPHGNVYLLSYVLQTSLNVDGHAITGWGGQDILLSSFKCDGTYRWSKDIGSNNTDVPVALKTDTLGGVYVTGSLYCDAVTDHVDVDSSWPGMSFKSIFLLKYDTAGHYKWFRMPEPDTAGIFTNAGPFDMDVDGAGNSYIFCSLDPGAFAGGSYIVPTQGNYILKYDNAGNFISGNPIQITGNTRWIQYALNMKRDNQLGRYYVTGQVFSGLAFGSTAITSSQFVGCFNNSGTVLWVRQGTDAAADGSAFGRAAVDAQHNIYLAGRATGSDIFNSYAFINGGSPATPFIVKLDTNGTNIWAKNAYSNVATNCSPITLNGNEVDISGSYPGKLTWPGAPDSLYQTPSAGYAIFITRFNATTGAVLGMDSIKSDIGNDNDATSMTADKFGNFYVGGDFPSMLYVPVRGDTLASIGGGSDFFVAKYGTSNCDTLIAEGASPGLSKGEEIIRVFPNPATEELNITGVAQQMSYVVYNITGESVQQGTLHTGSNTIDMLRFAPGVYILEMAGADGVRQVARVVKE